ncbi:MAG: hypothetical protein ABSF91_03040 [Bacteroidota bacterium]|jgi:hypothetical protein
MTDEQLNKIRIPHDIVKIHPENRDIVIQLMLYGLTVEIRTLTSLMLGFGDALIAKSKNPPDIDSGELFAKLFGDNLKSVNDWLAQFGTRTALPDSHEAQK